MDPTKAEAPAVDCSPIVASPERKNSLKSLIEHRPTREELIDKNILPSSNASPAIIAHRHDLEKSMLADSLKEKILKRPSPDALLEKGVLTDDPRRPSIDEEA